MENKLNERKKKIENILKGKKLKGKKLIVSVLSATLLCSWCYCRKYFI